MFLKLRAPEVCQKRMGQLRETREGLSRESGLKFWWEMEGGKPRRDLKQEAVGCLGKGSLAACGERLGSV